MNGKTENNFQLLTSDEVAKLLHISKSSFGETIAKKIPRAKVGTSYLYQLSDVIAYLNRIKTISKNE